MRLYSLRCEEECDLLSIDRDYLAELLVNFPNIYKEMKELAFSRYQLI